ncbi:MAG: TIGR00730 family Rossman fold protein [Acidobacteria bacterium]|nr:TIGR00730 family Rossman fold protein [Acidobacteriota bacterium]
MSVNDPQQILPPTLAYENKEFLDSSDGRIIRMMAEYLEPLRRFRAERIEDTVVFFGSARFHAVDVENKRHMVLLKNSGSTEAAPEEEQPADPADEAKLSALRLKRAAAAFEMARYYEDARQLAYLWTNYAKNLPGKRHRYVVTSGGGPGIMEAANRGAYEAGGKTIGLNIKLPFEQMPNPYVTPALNFEFHYFFMRKFWFAYLAKALVVFPGGFGTLDEMFELLTLAQTDKLARRIPVIIYGPQYWKNVINLEELAEKGTIAIEDVNLFKFADTPEEAFAILRDGIIAMDGDCETGDCHETPADVPSPSTEESLGPNIASTNR